MRRNSSLVASSRPTGDAKVFLGCPIAERKWSSVRCKIVESRMCVDRQNDASNASCGGNWRDGGGGEASNANLRESAN